MTRPLTTLIIVFSFFTACGQTQQNNVIFIHTYFNIDGGIFKTEKKNIVTDKILDLEFYRTEFYKPYHFPETFINTKFKNQTIEIWNDSTKPKDIKSNWSYTYYYDSLSRVTFYTFSSCFTCGQQAFNIQIAYDKKSRPIIFSVRHSFRKNLPESEKYEFKYDDKDNIIQLKYFSDGRLSEQIDKT